MIAIAIQQNLCPVLMSSLRRLYCHENNNITQYLLLHYRFFLNYKKGFSFTQLYSIAAAYKEAKLSVIFVPLAD